MYRALHSFRALGLVMLVTWLFGPTSAVAQQVREYEEGGVRYRETRELVRHPVVETQLEQRQQTVYRQRAEVQHESRTEKYWAPITEPRWVACWKGRFNPFVEPYVSYRLVNDTRWEQRVRTVQVPVVRTQVVPETITVAVPVTRQRTIEEEVIRRVAVDDRNALPSRGDASLYASIRPAGPLVAIKRSPSAVSTASVPPAREPVGGISRLESDPPRYSTAWHPARDGFR